MMCCLSSGLLEVVLPRSKPDRQEVWRCSSMLTWMPSAPISHNHDQVIFCRRRRRKGLEMTVYRKSVRWMVPQRAHMDALCTQQSQP
eukprot:728344-Pelagomonas_calceolata.AAC.1